MYTDAPIVSGRAMLIQDKELPSIFCKYISFPKHVFKPLSKVHVFLTVSWTNSSAVNSTPSTASKNDAAASWSEDLTSEGFRGCVLVAGRNTFEENRHKNNVSLHWVAMQKRSVEEHEGQAIGTMEFGTWYTGTRCQKLDKVTAIQCSKDAMWMLFYSFIHHLCFRYSCLFTTCIHRNIVIFCS